MTALWRSLLPARRGKRDISNISDYALELAGLPGGWGTLAPSMSSVTGTYGRQVTEPISNTLEGYARAAAANGVVFACMAVRMAVFSTIRFQFQRINRGKPSELFGTAALAPLEQPWAGGTTQDLLTRMIQDADLAGNSYWTLVRGELVRLRPDWVQIVLTPRMIPGARVGDEGAQVGWQRLGYAYYEGGIGACEPAVFLADEVSHFAPQPDPLATYRGMSWLTPILREIRNDGHMEQHRQAFFENAATPNLSVSLAKEVRPDAFKRFIEMMDLNHRGVENAYKTLYLGGGADVKVIGQDFQQMNFTAVQGHAETRIAAAAGVPPVIVGLSEGLQAATYSNYGQARRRFADGTMHPLWQQAAGSLAPLIGLPPRATPGDTRLFYDARDVPFLREDRRDAAEIVGRNASTVRQLIEAGFEPDAAVSMVAAEDLGLLLGRHTGLASVQLQPPATTEDVNDDSAPSEQDGDPEENTDA